MMLFNQSASAALVHQHQQHTNTKEDFPTSVRHLIYSYLDRSTVLQKISILSTQERLSLVDSELAAKNKSYRIEIAGQRNAQRQLYGEATRLKYVLRIIDNLTITA